MVRYHNLKVANQCVNFCYFCRETKGDFLSSESLNNLLNQPEMPESIRIFGGEPLMLDFLPDLIANLRRRGVRRVLIKTTAVPLSNFNLAFNLVSKGAHHFEVEFFSSKSETYQLMANSPDSLNLALHGISNLRRLTLESGQTPFLSFRMIVNSANLNELPDNLSFLLQFCPDRFVISLAPPLNEFSMTIKRIRESIKMANLNLVWLQTEGLPFCALGEDFYHYGELLILPYSNFFETCKLEDCLSCLASKICLGVPSFLNGLADFKLYPVLSSEKAQDFEFLSKEKDLN